MKQTFNAPTRRDMFAAAALFGVLVREGLYVLGNADSASEKAVELADALIAKLDDDQGKEGR